MTKNGSFARFYNRLKKLDAFPCTRKLRISVILGLTLDSLIG